MTLLQFLAELAQDPSRQLEFSRLPAETARASGLPESVIPALASRDSAQLRALLAEDSAGALIYSGEKPMVYSPETAFIYSSET
jgi:hypothetical protein